jgi:hypothetical protein
MADKDLMRLRERVSRSVARYSARADSATARARYKEAALVQAAVNRVTRQAIDRLGVSCILRVPYLNFGRQAWSLLTRFSGLTLERELDLVRQRWVERGLTPSVLAAVETDMGRAVADGELSRF